MNTPNNTPAGFRLNNPCNLRKDGKLCRFDSMTDGFRAALQRLEHFHRRDGLHSVKAMITRWTPDATEQHRKYYVRLVSAAASVRPGAYVQDPAICPSPWVDILVALAQAENGVETYDPKLLRSWAREAWERQYEE